MLNLFKILSNIPYYVYVIFIYIIVVGIKSLKSDTVWWPKLIVMPVILLVWSFTSLYAKYGASLRFFSLWFLFLLLGIFIGLYFIWTNGIKVNKQGLVFIKGSWYPLFFSLLFFCLKYYIGFTYAISPEMKSNLAFWLSDVILSGLISGIFLSRLLYIVSSYCKVTRVKIN